MPMTRPPNRARRVLDFFLDREGREISTYELERRFGRRSWRTAISDGRQLARLLRRDIKNVQYWRGRGTRRICDSRYALVKVSRKKAA